MADRTSPRWTSPRWTSPPVLEVTQPGKIPPNSAIARNARRREGEQ